MGAQAAVRVGRVRVAVLGAAEDRADIDAGLQPLLPQREALQLLQPVSVRGAVDDRVAEEVLAQAGEVRRSARPPKGSGGSALRGRLRCWGIVR